MATEGGPKLVSDGLVLHLDAANPKSYPGSGNTWFDLSGNRNDGTLVNGVGYNSANNGSMVFDGIDDHVRIISNDWGNPGEDITVLSFLKREGNSQDGNDYQSIFNSTDDAGSYNFSFYVINNDLSGWVHDGSNNFSFNSNFEIEIGIWYCVGFKLKNGPTFIIDTFVNGNPISNHSGNGVRFEGTSVNTIGTYVNRNAYEWNGDITTSQIYNRALSDAEIKQNFEATRSRYGI